MSDLAVNVKEESTFFVLNLRRSQTGSRWHFVFNAADYNVLIIVRWYRTCNCSRWSVKNYEICTGIYNRYCIVSCKVFSFCKLAVLINYYECIFIFKVDIIKRTCVCLKADNTVFCCNFFNYSFFVISCDNNNFDIAVCIVADKLYRTACCSNLSCNVFCWSISNINGVCRIYTVKCCFRNKVYIECNIISKWSVNCLASVLVADLTGCIITGVVIACKLSSANYYRRVAALLFSDSVNHDFVCVFVFFSTNICYNLLTEERTCVYKACVCCYWIIILCWYAVKVVWSETVDCDILVLLIITCCSIINIRNCCYNTFPLFYIEVVRKDCFVCLLVFVRTVCCPWALIKETNFERVVNKDSYWASLCGIANSAVSILCDAFCRCNCKVTCGIAALLNSNKVITNCRNDHLNSLLVSNLIFGAEHSVAVTADDTLSLCYIDVTWCPVICSNVTEYCWACAGNSLWIISECTNNDWSHLRSCNCFVGSESTIFKTGKNSKVWEDANSLACCCACFYIWISKSADCTKAENHSKCKNNCKCLLEIFHDNLFLL